MRTMNKVFRFLLMGALVCGLGLSVTSSLFGLRPKNGFGSE